MSRITLTVALSDDTAQEDIDATQAAIARLRGVQAVTTNVADIGDRVAFQRIKREVETAVKAALDNVSRAPIADETGEQENVRN